MTDSWLEELSRDDCLALLRSSRVGRIALVVDEFPVVLPVNYRLVETSGRTWIALRTRPGNIIERAPVHAAFEIDGIDPAHQQGWSVLVRGTPAASPVHGSHPRWMPARPGCSALRRNSPGRGVA